MSDFVPLERPNVAAFSVVRYTATISAAAFAAARDQALQLDDDVQDHEQAGLMQVVEAQFQAREPEVERQLAPLPAWAHCRRGHQARHRDVWQRERLQ